MAQSGIVAKRYRSFYLEAIEGRACPGQKKTRQGDQSGGNKHYEQHKFLMGE